MWSQTEIELNQTAAISKSRVTCWLTRYASRTQQNKPDHEKRETK